MEGSCLTGQSPQGAVVPVEEEEGYRHNFMFRLELTLMSVLELQM
jgi:hypothetical protein